MALRVKIPEAAGIRRSVEVQHARKGFALMLRRGLHGAKNWALELEEDGSHRSVWAKLFRVLVVLTPLWIVLSAVTGGPQRGGHSASVAQSLFMALLVLVIGLAVFSARERKLGREEPWADLEVSESGDTESNEAVDAPPEPVSSEAPTDILENPQVEEVGSAPEPAFRPDENDESEQKTQILPPFVPQAIENDDATLGVTGPEGASSPIREDFEQATSESAGDHAEHTPRNAPWTPLSEAPKVSLDKAIEEDPFEQVKGLFEEADDAVPQATGSTPEMLITDGDRNDLLDTPTVPFRPSFRTAFRETEKPQVEAQEGSIQGTIQPEFPCLAERGPYPAKPDPIHDDWWVVAPDVEPQEEPVTEAATASVDASYDPWAPLETSDLPEALEGPVTASASHPYEVQRYFASRISMDVEEGEREEARTGVMAWAIAEVSEGRRSQAEIVRLLGIGKATVSRWVNAESGDAPE
jgi:hypothetical protein